jgi:hypothetical protein
MPTTRPTELHTRRATVALNSFDPAVRTFTAIAATDKPILRSDPFDGDYYEVLSMRPGAVRMQRLASGRSPILDNHRAASAADQLGVITRGAVRDGQVVIDGKLTQADVATPLAQSIGDGVAVNVSVGYRVHRSERSKGADGIPIITRTDWEPIEVSLVPVAADPETYIRNQRGRTMPQAARRKVQRATRAEPDVPIDEHEDDIIETRDGDDVEMRSADDRHDDPPPRQVMSRRAETMARSIARQHGLDNAFVARCIDRGMTLQTFRGAVLDELAVRSATAPRQRVQHTMGRGDDTLDNPNFRGTAIRDALLARMAGKPAAGAATEFRSLSLLQMGAECVQMRGERPDWSSHDKLLAQIFTRAAGMHSTSDFPGIVSNVANKRVLDTYQAAVGPWLALSRQRPASDFKPLTLLRLGEHPVLKKNLEGEEIKYVTRTEGKEAYAVETYAGKMALTRKLLINDDAGAFDDMAVAQGRAASETVNSLFVALFIANNGAGANLGDGNPLYTTTRGNKAASGGAIDVTTLGAGRQALRLMKGLDGKTPIGVTPKHVVVGPAKETEAELVLADLAAAQVSDQNPFAGKLTLHVEPRFTGNAWRIFADPSELEVLNHSYLNGQDGPIVDMQEGWDVLGVEFRVILDFGAGLVDWRGTYLNPGN